MWPYIFILNAQMPLEYKNYVAWEDRIHSFYSRYLVKFKQWPDMFYSV